MFWKICGVDLPMFWKSLKVDLHTFWKIDGCKFLFSRKID